MRLLELVPCGRRGLLLHDEEEEEEEGCAVAPTSTLRRVTEETVAVLNTGGRENRRTSRRRGWRPSLVAISEHSGATAALNGKKPSDERNFRSSSASTATRPRMKGRVTAVTVRAQPRPAETREDDFRHFAVPAFAPTAFLF